MPIQDTDLLLVNRNRGSFKTEYSEIKEDILTGVKTDGVYVDNRAPIGDSNEGDLWWCTETHEENNVEYFADNLYIWVPNQTEGVVNAVSLRRGGNGYPDSGTNAPTLNGEGHALTLNYTATGGEVQTINVNAGGHGYIQGDLVTIKAGLENSLIEVTGVSAITSGEWVDTDQYQYSADTVKRNQKDRLRERLSLWDFIPTAEHENISLGTSAYDCTADFQSALDSGAGHIFVPGGTYNVSRSIEVPSNVTIEGVNPESTIIISSSDTYTFNIERLSDDDGNAIATPKRHSSIRNLTIESDGVTESGSLIRLRGARECQLSNLMLEGRNKVQYCLHIQSPQGFGNYYNSFFKVDANRAQLANIYINGDPRITGLRRSNANYFYSCKCDYAQTHAWLIVGVDNCALYGCSAEFYVQSGIKLGIDGETPPTGFSMFGGYLESNQPGTPYAIDGVYATGFAGDTARNCNAVFYNIRLNPAQIRPGSLVSIVDPGQQNVRYAGSAPFIDLYQNNKTVANFSVNNEGRVSWNDPDDADNRVYIDRLDGSLISNADQLQIGRGGAASFENGVLRLGSHYLWVHNNKLMIKASAPSSNTDGNVIGP